MNELFTRVDSALRAAVHRVQLWFDPPLDREAAPLEVREAIIEAIEQRVEPTGAGRRVLPYNRITVTMLAADKLSRARLQAALGGLQESIAGRLAELRCAIPAGFAVETRYITRVPATWTPDQRLAFAYDQRDAPPRLRSGQAGTPSAIPNEPPPLQITVARGQATQASYTFAESHVRIGRSAQPIDGRGRPRTNQVVFLENGDDHARTVGRAHASIRYDTTRREYRVFDDGSHNGTRVVRDGAVLEVKPHDPVGVTLRSGDKIQVGTAALRIQI
jgi:hypothetical protein